MPQGLVVGGGDDDSLPTSDDIDADADDDSNDSQHQSDQNSVNDNASQQSYHTCDGHHSDLFENCFERVPTTLVTSQHALYYCTILSHSHVPYIVYITCFPTFPC